MEANLIKMSNKEQYVCANFYDKEGTISSCMTFDSTIHEAKGLLHLFNRCHIRRKYSTYPYEILWLFILLNIVNHLGYLGICLSRNTLVVLGVSVSGSSMLS